MYICKQVNTTGRTTYIYGIPTIFMVTVNDTHTYVHTYVDDQVDYNFTETL